MLPALKKRQGPCAQKTPHRHRHAQRFDAFQPQQSDRVAQGVHPGRKPEQGRIRQEEDVGREGRVTLDHSRNLPQVDLGVRRQGQHLARYRIEWREVAQPNRNGDDIRLKVDLHGGVVRQTRRLCPGIRDGGWH